jgi:hypothetical protein
MAKTKTKPETRTYLVSRYPSLVEFEAHLNYFASDGGETELVAGRFTIVTYNLHTFSIDSRDGSIVAVYHRGV